MSSLKKYQNKKGQSFPHLYMDVVTGEFWAVVRVGKKIRKRNLKTTEYVRAIATLPQVLTELGDEKSQKTVEEMAPLKLLSDYWADLRKAKVADDTSQSTLTRMDTIWKHHLSGYLGSWRPDQIHPGMIPDFVEWHRKHKPGVQLINVYKYMGNLFHHMVKVGALLPTQLPELKVPKNEKKHHDKMKGRILTDDERGALRSNGTPRIQLINSLLDDLGNRVMEIGALEKKRILREDGRMFLELTEDDTKTGLPRILPVPLHTEVALNEQILASEESEYLFPNKSGGHVPYQVIHKEWRECVELSKIKGKVKIHNWRHTRATIMARMKINPIVACTLLGMTIAIYQKKYLKLTGRDLVETVDQMTRKVEL